MPSSMSLWFMARRALARDSAYSPSPPAPTHQLRGAKVASARGSTTVLDRLAAGLAAGFLELGLALGFLVAPGAGAGTVTEVDFGFAETVCFFASARYSALVCPLPLRIPSMSRQRFLLRENESQQRTINLRRTPNTDRMRLRSSWPAPSSKGLRQFKNLFERVSDKKNQNKRTVGRVSRRRRR